MDYEQNRIKQWMRRIGQETPERPTLPNCATHSLRYDIIDEELQEYWDAGLACYDAADTGDPKQLRLALAVVADALADLVVVVKGTAVAFGIDLQPVLEEVFRSNDSKVIDGYKREDGKWMKGPSYVPPNLEPIIRKQMEE